jgi:hypothetical protein
MGGQSRGWQPGELDAGRRPVDNPPSQNHQSWDHNGWDQPIRPGEAPPPAGHADPYARPYFPEPAQNLPTNGHQHGLPMDAFGRNELPPVSNQGSYGGGQPQPAARGSWPPPFDAHERQAPIPQPHPHDPYLAGGGRPEAPAYGDAWRDQQPYQAPRAPAYRPADYPPPDPHHAPPFGGAPHNPHAPPPQGYGAPQGYFDPGHHQPAPGGPLGHAAPDAGYGHQPAARRQDSWPPGEHETWDLSQYAPGQVPAEQQLSAYAPTPGQGHPADYGHGGPQGQWPGHAQEHQHWGQDPRGYEQPLDPQFGDQHTQYQDYNEFAAPGGVEGDEDYEEEEEVEPRRRPRTFLIALVLVGAIGIGGGVAYTYKNFGATNVAGDTPVVRADQSPAKQKPAEPGGKDVPNIDKKFLNRLTEDRPTATAALATQPSLESEGGTRKVTTLVVNRDGTLTPQLSSAVPAAEAPPPPPSSGVPGMLIEGFGSPPPQRAAAPEPPPPPRVTVTNAPPKVADLPMPKVRAEPVAPRKRVAVRDDAAAPAGRATTTASTPAASTGANGYVAVLSSRKTREEALRNYADMYQKYPDALANRTPDVLEANLGDKGLWYRLIVGPPGSREAANDVCVKLKAQGFTGCWATAY